MNFVKINFRLFGINIIIQIPEKMDYFASLYIFLKQLRV